MGASLPAAVLSEVLRRVPPRGLAACRCVCRKWRAIIDGRRMLRRDLLPLAVGGIFLSVARMAAPPEFFARPSPAAREIAGRLERYVDTDGITIPTLLDCCNGLLLLGDQVVNPATMQCAIVPPACSSAWPDEYGLGDAYLVFDPLVSPNDYKVVLIQDQTFFEHKLEDGSEWPPSSYTMWIYDSSATTGGWEERPFVRDGGPAGTFADARSAGEPEARHAVYWRGALYVHCTGDFIMRIALSDYKYQVIKLPAGVHSRVGFDHHLAKSKNGVYFALVRDGFRLQVWFLNEVSGNTEWVYKYDINLHSVDANFVAGLEYPVARPWILQGGYCNQQGNNNNRGKVVEEAWDSDDDNILEIEDTVEKRHSGQVSIFGFHPFKEVAFLQLSSRRVVACHLDSSKLQDLGQLSLPYYGDAIDTTFVYTPCWIGDLSQHNKCMHL